MRIHAKMLEKEAESLKKQADEVILPILMALDVKGYEHEKLGKVSRRVTGPRLNANKAKENLVMAGVRAETVADAFETATTGGGKEFVVYTLPKT